MPPIPTIFETRRATSQYRQNAIPLSARPECKGCPDFPFSSDEMPISIAVLPRPKELSPIDLVANNPNQFHSAPAVSTPPSAHLQKMPMPHAPSFPTRREC